MSEKRQVRRHEKVNFLEVGSNYLRMKGFKSMGQDKNAQEYSRQYVDDPFETTDVVGMSPSLDFEMDRIKNDEVHEKIVSIFDEEKLGDDANVNILEVDFTEKVTDGDRIVYKAKKRQFALVPETEGGELEAFTYEGTFKAKGSAVKGYAVFAADLAITDQVECTFETELS